MDVRDGRGVPSLDGEIEGEALGDDAGPARGTEGNGVERADCGGLARGGAGSGVTTAGAGGVSSTAAGFELDEDGGEAAKNAGWFTTVASGSDAASGERMEPG